MRTSRYQIYHKIAVLKKSAKPAETHLKWNPIFNKTADPGQQPC